MINIYVNDQKIICEDKELLIKVLKDNNIFIPHFCYHESLGADGNCRMCLVEIEGSKRPQIACDTFVYDGLRVHTKTKSIQQVNRDVLELELLSHPVDCPTCDQAGECSLQNYYMEYGLYDSRVSIKKNKKDKAIDLGSNIMLDQERCVLCMRCVRFCSDITKTDELVVMGRGNNSYITTTPFMRLSNPYSMNVIDLCPVGALTSKDFRFKQRVWFLDSTPSICHGCSKNCAIYIDHNAQKNQNDHVHRFRPRHNPLVNGYFICDEGRLSYKKTNQTRKNDFIIKSRISTYESILKHTKKLLKSENAIALVSCSLSVEQMLAIKELSEEYLFDVYYDYKVDEKFGDDFLKSSIKESNLYTAKLLDFKPVDKHYEESLISKSLILNFNSEFISKPRPIEMVEFLTHEGKFERSSSIFTYEYFHNDKGLLINSDGVISSYKKSSRVKSEKFTLLKILNDLLDESYTNESIYEKYKELYFKNIAYDKILKQSQRLGL